MGRVVVPGVVEKERGNEPVLNGGWMKEGLHKV